MKRISLVIFLIFFGLLFQELAYSDQRTKTWDGWDFVITRVYSDGMMLYVKFCNKSGKGKDGHVNITCNIQGKDFVRTKVYCASGDCRKVSFRIPDTIFQTVLGDPHKISKSIAGRRPPVPQSATLNVPISIKGGPIGWHQFYYTERKLRFEK